MYMVLFILETLEEKLQIKLAFSVKANLNSSLLTVFEYRYQPPTLKNQFKYDSETIV